MKHSIRYHAFIALTGLSLIVVILSMCRQSDTEEKTSFRGIQPTEEYAAGFAGRESCRDCHQKQYDLFIGSDHDMAMDSANVETVLGDFSDATYTQGNITTTFFKRDNGYFVNTEGPEGTIQDYEIKFTFGIRPLQQYLVEFPGGRYQMLPFCWDTRPAEEGGQRWFHIYDRERIPPDDVLFWTRIMQNWNYMCSECHSTNVKKRYDLDSDSYYTTWSEIDVSCEACHGPGLKHIEWARHVEQGGNQDLYPEMGLAIRLKDTDDAVWIFDMETGTAQRSIPRKSGTLIEMCGRCHSRRSVTTEDYRHGNHLLETHWPSLLEEGLYFPDGQILEEVYVYASFLQSKMYHKGVSCKDCHEPHSGKVFIHGNALCYRCHLADKYGDRSHHFHDPSQSGGNCFDCHMPERTYMVIDPRRDHSIRIPRPDLSDKLGSPNACNSCHDDKSNQWSAIYLEQWYGTVEEGKTHYGETFRAGRLAYPEARPELISLAEDTSLAPLIRSTAISLLQNYNDPSVTITLRNTIKDPDPLVRFAAVHALTTAEVDVIADLAPIRLNDSIRLIRILAARMLSTVPADYLSRTTNRIRNAALNDYIQSQMINADHPSAHMNLGVLYLNQGDYNKAESAYKKAIEIEPGFVMSYINLADLYRIQGRDQEGEQVLRKALETYPDLAAVHHSLGLLLVRRQEREEAIEHLKEAAILEPGNARFCYVYGVGLHSQGKSKEAITYLEGALKDHPFDREILYTLATLNQEQGNIEIAKKHAEKLVEYYPKDQNYQQLHHYLLAQ